MITLADPALIDVIISIGYLAAIIVVLRAALRRRSAPGDRILWSAIAVGLVTLVVNQQSDMHVRVMGAGAELLESQGWLLLSTPVRIALALLLLSLAAIIAWVVAWNLRNNNFPGCLVSLGLLLLAAHALGRSARFLHVLRGPGADQVLPSGLKAAEGAGLVLVIVGTLRWQARTEHMTQEQNGSIDARRPAST